MNNTPSKFRNGFTLIEALVAIAIVAILAAIAIPSFLDMTQRYRVIRESNALAGDFQLARTEAIKRGAPVTICVSSDGASCTGGNSWKEGWIVQDPAVVANPLKVQKSWGGTDTITADNAVSSITFSRDGFATLPDDVDVVTFTVHTTPVKNNNATKCIAMNKAGRQQTQAFGTAGCT